MTDNKIMVIIIVSLFIYLMSDAIMLQIMTAVLLIEVVGSLYYIIKK